MERRIAVLTRVSPRYNWLVAGVLARLALEFMLAIGQWARFVVMRNTIKRRMRALLADWRRGAAGACVAAAALLCASCGTGDNFREVGRTIGEIVGTESGAGTVETTREILLRSHDVRGVFSVFDETILQYRDAPAALDTVGEIFRPSDEGLIWTIKEILR